MVLTSVPAPGKLISGLAVSGLSQRMKSTSVHWYAEKLRAAAVKLGGIVSPS
jgi:DNA-binding IclR family transcriptional regulator